MNSQSSQSDMCNICFSEVTEPVNCQVCKKLFCILCARVQKTLKNQCPLKCHESPWKINVQSMSKEELQQHISKEEEESDWSDQSSIRFLRRSQLLFEINLMYEIERILGNRQQENDQQQLVQHNPLLEQIFGPLNPIEQEIVMPRYPDPIINYVPSQEGAVQYIKSVIQDQLHNKRYLEQYIDIQLGEKYNEQRIQIEEQNSEYNDQPPCCEGKVLSVQQQISTKWLDQRYFEQRINQ